jgi:hypothetical protein
MVWMRFGVGVCSIQPYSFIEEPRESAFEMIRTNEFIAFKSNVTTIIRESISNGSKVF